MGNYAGIDNIARELIKSYGGVEDIARDGFKMYAGVDGIAREIVFKEGVPSIMIGTLYGGVYIMKLNETYDILTLTTAGGADNNKVFQLVILNGDFYFIRGALFYKYEKNGFKVIPSPKDLSGNNYTVRQVIYGEGTYFYLIHKATDNTYSWCSSDTVGVYNNFVGGFLETYNHLLYSNGSFFFTTLSSNETTNCSVVKVSKNDLTKISSRSAKLDSNIYDFVSFKGKLIAVTGTPTTKSVKYCDVDSDLSQWTTISLIPYLTESNHVNSVIVAEDKLVIKTNNRLVWTTDLVKWNTVTLSFSSNLEMTYLDGYYYYFATDSKSLVRSFYKDDLNAWKVITNKDVLSLVTHLLGFNDYTL